MKRDDELTRALIAAIGKGLPLEQKPYAALAEQLGCGEAEVIDGIRRLAMRGDLKRFGVVVRHRKLGYRANAMVVWDIPDTRVAEIGHAIGEFTFVTLCYQRPRRLPDWPYNLFCMIHGRDRDAVSQQVDQIAAELGLQQVNHRILFSGRCFKQRGAAYRQPAQALDG
ncbi:MAG: AsnC family protein [Gammaproteobacteria bacterium]|nr:AsnC family protein [Gammaproteobacteria bacterium]